MGHTLTQKDLAKFVARTEIASCRSKELIKQIGITTNLDAAGKASSVFEVYYWTKTNKDWTTAIFYKLKDAIKLYNSI